MSDKTQTLSTKILKLPAIPTDLEVQWDSEVHECRRAVERTNVWWTSIKKLNNIAQEVIMHNYDKMLLEAIDEDPRHDLDNARIIADFCSVEITFVFNKIRTLREQRR